MNSEYNPGFFINWLPPWEGIITGRESILKELQREVGLGHPLFDVDAVPIAKRTDSDDILFHLPGSTPSLAVVHLTWSRQKEPPPHFPHTDFFDNPDCWIEQCMKPDNRNFNDYFM